MFTSFDVFFIESIDFNEILYTIYSDLYSNIIFYSLLLYIFDYNYKK